MMMDTFAAITLVLNAPLDLEKLAGLLQDKEDLFLVWPDAEYPFNREQWKKRLDETKGHRSYFITNRGEIVGHAALLRTEKDIEWSLGFLYLKPEFRSRGIGKMMIQELEEIARNELRAKVLALQVRDYNSRALKAYVGAGFKEVSREGTLIRMRKNIHETGGQNRESQTSKADVQ